jgi:hypothetical protein
MATTGTTGGTTGGSTVGAFAGNGGVLIVEAGCDVIWDMSGSATNGMDLSWAMDLTLTDAGSCDFGDNNSGTFTVEGGGAYWDGDYWGAATSGGGNVAWATAGYVYGAGGYTYVYNGSGSY